MAKTGIFHHVGTFLLFVSSILLLITTITSPVVNDISMLEVNLSNRAKSRASSVTFGTFGYCIFTETFQTYCTAHLVGYRPAILMLNIAPKTFSPSGYSTTDRLTHVQVLHPIVCSLAFVAFLLALGSGFFGALLASAVALLTFILTLVVLITDFICFGIVKHAVNSDGSGSRARFGAGMWTELVALVALGLATLLVLFTCFSARRHRNQGRYGAGRADKNEYPMVGTAAPKRKFWQRKGAY